MIILTEFIPTSYGDDKSYLYKYEKSIEIKFK